MIICLRLLLLINLFLQPLVSCNAIAAEKLVFAIDIIRHGDRTPIEDIPAASHQWDEGFGQLTARGMNQEYALGQHLRRRYINDFKLLDDKYSSTAIYVRSTDYDRTLMSAQSLLLGLYPLGTGPRLPNDKFALPAGFQPIPIHTVSKSTEKLLIPDLYNEFKQLVQDHVFSKPEWKEKQAALQSKYAAWSAASGVEINDLTDLIALGDSLEIYRLHGIPLPPGLTHEDVEEIIRAKEWTMTALFRNQIIGAATGGALLKTVVSQIKESAEGKNDKKWILFSAHDSTLLAQLSALGAPQNKVPSYASDLNISLFKRDGQYKVRVRLNDQPISIPLCGGTECTVDQFQQLQADAIKLLKFTSEMH